MKGTRTKYLTVVLVNEELLELIQKENLSDMPPSDASEDDPMKALKKRVGTEKLPDSMDPGAQIVDRIMNLKTDVRGYLERHGWKEHVHPGDK